MAAMKLRRLFKRDIAALDSLFEFIESCADICEIDGARRYTLQLVVEELFTNLVKYDPHAASDIPVIMDKHGTRLTVELVNRDGTDFDVSRVKSLDIDRRLQDRKIGGLGLHLVKHMVDDIRYEYNDGTGRITIVLFLEEERA
jgi:anti-sigma regulatory factor (Ser/Thr protein kinase)